MTSEESAASFDPERLYELKELADRWNYSGGVKNLEKALREAGANVVCLGGKGIKLVRFREMFDPR